MIFDDPNRENWENLANSIIWSAVKDFRRIYRKYLMDPKYKFYEEKIVNLIRFFTSEYFLLLTSLDGPTLVRNLKQEVEEKVASEKKKRRRERRKPHK